MPPIPRSLTELIGNTPLLEPARYNQREGCTARLLLKLECFNPLRSSKDRVALALVEDAERRGLLNRVCRGSAGQMVAAFLKEETLTAQERDELRRLLDEMEV